MQRAALRRRVRVMAQGTVEPFLWADEDINAWLDEAQHEAAIRARLLRATPHTHPSLCEFSLSAGESAVTVPGELFEISRQEFSGGAERIPLRLVSREWLDGACPNWRTLPADEPAYLVQDIQSLQIVPPPSVAGTLLLEGYRLPASMQADEDEPDIPAVHHLYLTSWALHVGYSVPDADTFDPGRSEREEAKFTRYFGLRPDADLRALSRQDEQHHNVAY